MPIVVPLLQVAATSVRALARDERAAAEAVRLRRWRSATVPLGDLTSEQMRVLGELARAYGDGTVRVTIGSGPGVPLGAARATCAQLYRRLAAAGLGLAEARDDRRRDELPGRGVVPARGDAVARPRAAARGSPARAARSRSPPPTARASRSAAARTAAASITSRRSASRAASAGSAARACRSTS